jgi:putative protease
MPTKKKKPAKKAKPVKKTKKVKKAKPIKKAKAEKSIGKITHYFGHINVAVIKLSDKLKVGEEIRIVGGETDFNQEVKSMEVEHEKIKEAKKGASVGLKVEQKVREDYKVFRVK